MASLRDIRKRIASVKNTQKITNAMKMVSAAKLRRAEEAIKAARPFAEKMREVLMSLAARANPSAHPMLEVRPVQESPPDPDNSGSRALRGVQYQPESAC